VLVGVEECVGFSLAAPSETVAKLSPLSVGWRLLDAGVKPVTLVVPKSIFGIVGPN
jgi:hypothetical protein